ncbi:hypothetical protein ACCS88_21265 [Rhizobium ruizarguesonis]
MKRRSEEHQDFSKIERGLNHFIVWQWVYRDKRKVCLPILYVMQQTSNGGLSLCRVDSVLRYCDDNWRRSSTWHLYRVRTLGLLIDYTFAWLPFLRRASARGSTEGVHRRMLERFAKAILNGTAMLNNGARIDGVGLYWRPRAEIEAKKCLSALTNFLTSLSNDSDDWSHAASSWYVDPLSAIRIAHQVVVRNKMSLLAHLAADRDDPAPPHSFPGYFSPIQTSGATYRFPIKFVWDFLFHGFVRKDGRSNVVAQIVAFILFAGGMRASELFHVWVQDVQFVHGEAFLFLHHPEDAMVIDRTGKAVRRKERLLSKGRLPRTQLRKRDGAGWKGLDGEADGALIHWLPIPELQNHLSLLLAKYLAVDRPNTMRLRASRGLSDHDYLFVSPGDGYSDGNREIGKPYTMAAFKAAWKRAIRTTARRCNDVALTVRKRMGTTIHGARHFYGCFLKTLGCDGELIARCMHHKNTETQRRYTKLSNEEINSILKGRANAVPGDAALLSKLKRQFDQSFARRRAHTFAAAA